MISVAIGGQRLALVEIFVFRPALLGRRGLVAEIYFIFLQRGRAARAALGGRHGTSAYR